eukprot:Blabericola_migrator_1__1614@NODE_1431_length_4555_cov_25_944519_g951_i0_p1_GENE_NODE_1431_length_4555_cov_25_944519_g951_i0NODE_1431_length_4555_cov_25_944519_g951_i0_p1_ORF_typecomplete_len601_score69_17_NODE_1431_length_4555_cov_25_944519_g951_i020493851
MISSEDESPDRFLAVGNIFADFDGSHIPVLLQVETRTDPPNAQAVEEILKAYDEDLPIEALIEANFPEGDFQNHLIRYLRNRMRLNLYCGRPQTRLKHAYLIGVKDWCAAAVDAFISQIEEGLTVHGESSKAADSEQGKKSAQWTRQFFLEQTALHQRRARKFVGERSFEMADTWCWWHVWSDYRKEYRATHDVAPASPMQAEKSDTNLMLDELRLISAVLRNIYPGFFEFEAKRIAGVLESFGAPCHLINLLQNMRLDPEDVAEYEHAKSSVQGAHDPDPKGAYSISTAERGDVPKNTSHMIYPLDVLEEYDIHCAAETYSLPPFFQLGYEVENIKSEAIKKIVEFFKSWEKDKALSVVDEEFSGAKDSHGHFFGFLRTAMRDYVLPKVLNGSEEACNLYDIGTPLGEILHTYVKLVQKWCARVHEGLTEKLFNTIIAARQSHTRESSDLIEWVRKVEAGYTLSLNALMDQIDLSSVEARPPPPETSMRLPAPVARLRESLYTLSWLMQNMPWNSFLLFRTNLASLVREVDRGKQGYSFLANILETLSFTEGDADEFRKHHKEMLRLDHERWYRSQFEGPFKTSLKQDLSPQATGAVRK